VGTGAARFLLRPSRGGGTGYFREKSLRAVHVGDSAKVTLLGCTQGLSGYVAGIIRAISVPGTQPNPQGLVVVNPIFTWARLVQRVPVQIRLDHLPPGLQLVAGMSATIEIEPPPRG
jgi:multidrug resistance efflux pump